MMSDSEEEEQYPFLGTPLEPIEEGDIPKKKPLGIQDQIATDKYGRRRFHGAFTGGFSAGHFNSVGTPEGWKPSSFKSSRSTKVDSKNQRPEDFMDDEDMEDFGIAPSVVRAKSEYSGSKSTKKRERVNFQDGPIPGEPVLQKILEPSKNTVGVLLLMKMGWKPGQGIGPRLSKMEKRLQKRKLKREKGTSTARVYGCALKSPSSSDESGSDEDLDIDTLFAPDDVDVIFAKAKTDVFGMGYSGLDRSSVLSVKQNDPSKAVPDTFRLMDNNKKLAIRGQAFGVGAFEEEDADIYARDDMSQYDFALETPASLREKRKEERAAKEKLLAITGGEDVIEGFVAAKKPSAPKKYFPPPTLPPGYQTIHTARKSRFGPERTSVPDVRGPKKALDAEDRAVILGEKSSIRKATEDKANEEKADQQTIPELPPPDPKDDLNFKPFVADPTKQARYEKYLQLVKIGAKDAFTSLQPKNMSEWEKERERTEFEQAAKLYRPLSGMMADRFSRAELPDESLDPLAPVAKMSHGVTADMAAAAKSKMFGKLTRSIDDWAPVSLVCKRMNIAEPLNRGGRSLCEIAKDRTQPKSRFSVFDILVDSDNPFSSYSRKKDSDSPTSSAAAGLPPQGKLSSQTSQISEPEKPTPSVLDEISDPFEKIKFDDPAEKKDLFKAIFCDSEDEEDTPPTPKVVPPRPSEASQQNVLRNTSPPRGIFANLNLDKLNEKKPCGPNVEKEEPSNKVTSNDTVITVSGGSVTVPPNPNDKEGDSVNQLLYGPALPTKPMFVQKSKTPSKPVVSSSDSSSSSSDEEQWVEKDSSSSTKKKKKKRKVDKKEKKRKKKKKHKEQKEHKRKHRDKRK